MYVEYFPIPHIETDIHRELGCMFIFQHLLKARVIKSSQASDRVTASKNKPGFVLADCSKRSHMRSGARDTGASIQTG